MRLISSKCINPILWTHKKLNVLELELRGKANLIWYIEFDFKTIVIVNVINEIQLRLKRHEYKTLSTICMIYLINRACVWMWEGEKVGKNGVQRDCDQSIIIAAVRSVIIAAVDRH